MTARWGRSPGGTYAVTMEGSWGVSDAAELKRILDEIPRDQDRVILDSRALDGLTAGWVQTVLAYTRYCRSVPRPVSVEVSADQSRFLAAWGLDRSGWEGFFHAG